LKICVLSDEGFEVFNPAMYLSGYDWEMCAVHPPIEEYLRAISQGSRHVLFLNIFDGFNEDDHSGLELVQAFERLNLPFTGADSGFYDPTREQMQAVAEATGLRFARGFHAASEKDLELAGSLKFPLIVKHPNSFASSGMTRESRVNTFHQLREQFKRISGLYHSARVEEFVEGRELTCLLVDNPDDLSDPYAYPPAEVSFPVGESFLHVEVKWMSWDKYIIPLQDDSLARRVRDISREFYKSMGGVGYARVDLRLRDNGDLVILEINPNCGILYAPEDRGPADLPISWDKGGHAGFLDRIFRSAILRHELRTRS
jgi:D-alanine-D-alanine ligase